MPVMPDQPPLLAQRAGSSPRPAAAPDTDALSLDEAIAIYGLSQSTLRRRLRAGDIAGAFKVNGPKGEEWRLPRGALEHLGYHAKETSEPAAPPPAPAAPASDDVAAALRLVADSLGRLDTAQRQLQAAEEDRGRVEREREDARVEAATLRAQLEAARASAKVAQERAERLEDDLAEVRRRRWWQR